ncbi:MAG: 2,3,4,5-tetrahydropyridine-2,6-dicarboxylate N-succinyltransferase [Ignavibacteriales bacterium]|nr:2,3,4,5-tetrahydropyridine-2,6-dicarboxylate N-succinyltransferase [Ignavibacteriales bacterium]
MTENIQKEILSQFGKQTLNGSATAVFTEFLELLDGGKIRSAEKINGTWHVHEWVKKGILLGFWLGTLKSVDDPSPFQYFDKHTIPLKQFNGTSNVRIVPGGTSIRKGAYLAPSVIVMPPAYINIGSYVDEGTMIDSHALVGSCAQVGKRVHVSAAAQIGGVLEPIGAMPVIIEDDVMIGGNCGIYEGTIVKKGSVIASGVILTASTPVYDLVHHTIIRREENGSLIIPENSVVVAGNRKIESPFAMEFGLSLYTPLIVKYRDEKTNARIALEESLR